MTEIQENFENWGRDSLPIQKLIQDFLHVRQVTEEICAPLSEEDFMISVTGDTSPIKWHLAHTTWFYENFILKKLDQNFSYFNESFQYFFNSYYKRVGGYIPKVKRNSFSRPNLHEVYEYRRLITEKVIHLCHFLSRGERDYFYRTLELGIHHEEQHQELILMDIKRNFFENPMRPQYQDQSLLSAPIDSEPRWVKMHSGMHNIGVQRDATHFSYDNEKDEHLHWIDSFYLSSHLVTNEDYLEFIEDGGYENPLLWLSDGWDQKEIEQWSHPLYWEKRGEEWWTMTLSGMIPIDWKAPVVHINYYEAKAFAQWKGCRLPTEFEWEMAAKLEHSKGQFFEDGNFEPEASLNDHEVFSQIHGSVWEWTESAYLSYPRYRPFQEGLSEYNEKFMCNQMVLRGGSCLTPFNHYRPTYRNFYYPHMRWQYAGLRLAKDVYT